MKRLGKNQFGLRNTTAVQTIITPAENTDGVYIRTAGMTAVSGGHAALMAHTEAPENSMDMNARGLLYCYSAEAAQLSEEVFVPAGYGVYWHTNVQSNSSLINISWDHKETL